MHEQDIDIINRLGLHARAATKFANLANRFQCAVTVQFGEKCIDGKSIMSLMLLAAAKGSRVRLKAEGEDAGEALQALCDLINNRFDEDE